MKTRNNLSLFLLAVTTAVMLLPDAAGAIPAFARRYKLSCTTCHTPFPRLKPFGDEFAANGFIIPEEEKDRDYISAGDDLLHLNKDFPVAVRFDAFATLQKNEEDELQADMQMPFGLKLLSGGALSRGIGYYFYFYMSEKGEVAGVEDAYIHFNDLGGRPLDILVGQFQACDPLMKRELRLTYEDYLIYKSKIGLSNTNLAYDRGVIVNYDLERSGTLLTAMVLNGNGKDPAEATGFDSDKYKNFFLRVGQGVTDNVSVGLFGYYGDELGQNPKLASAGTVFRNSLLFHGLDLKAGNGTLDGSFQYLRRRDTNPLFLPGSIDAETTGLVGEVVISPQQDRSRHYVTLLYNRIDSGLDAADYETYTAAVTRLHRRNLRLTVEFTYDVEHGASRGAVGIVSAF
ncbi:hypothetical protein CO151_11755 [bacterium CG_4_9_14_3_um_filter_65_15]|nr:MAG: hypothetical protein CO151_11755 [bacterium CG_4_9_14_3_um_filter_65_15]